MGAWGEEILASDDAYDVIDGITRIIRPRIDHNNDEWYAKINKEELETYEDELLEYGENHGDIALNVLAYLIVTTGAHLPLKYKKYIPSTTNEDVSTWKNPTVRIARLKELRDAVSNYKNDGKPVELSVDKGLLNKIFEWKTSIK